MRKKKRVFIRLSLPIFMTIVNSPIREQMCQCQHNFDHKVIKPAKTPSLRNSNISSFLGFQSKE